MAAGLTLTQALRLLQASPIAALLLATSMAAAEGRGTATEFPPRYRHFGVYDYVETGLALGAYYLVETTQKTPHSARWTGTLPLDRPVRSLLVADSLAGRLQANDWSDRFWYASVAYPVLDALVTPTVRGSVATSWNMTMMNLQAFAVVSLVLRMPHKWVGRERPDAIGCAKDPNYTWHCNNDGLYVSFPGGHLAVSMAGAGLSCAHHLHGHLYGSRPADSTACAVALAAASLVGYFRLRADSHWFSDQVAGAFVGLLSGYALPTLVYYRPWAPPAPRSAGSQATSVRWTVLPELGERSLGASLAVFH